MTTGTTAEFGYTCWGRDFLRLAEPTRVTRPEPLLPRARSLARNAMSAVQCEDRLVRGTVVRGGAASVAYLEFAPMPRDAARAVAERVGGAPSTAALTDEVHAALAGDPPELAAVDCSCRARSARCVHVLALLYETVRRVDEDPRLALSLRGYSAATGRPGAASSDAVPRWTPLTALDPASFYG
ncbi:SWIM zinc finger family protein [Gordonia sp. FQ]|uniref:SWIM zinc finger family protein n=1 Tax=Gordonia sp. FQ TaxID=3446634 RepID=UPI003F835AAF